MKIAHLELSNEVYLVLIEQLELPKDQSVKHALSMLSEYKACLDCSENFKPWKR